MGDLTHARWNNESANRAGFYSDTVFERGRENVPFVMIIFAD